MGVTDQPRAKTPARDMAEQMLLERPDIPYAVYTDMATVPDRTIVGIAVRGRFSALLVIDAAEWNEDWKRNLALLDSVSPPETPTNANARAHADAVRLSRSGPSGRPSAAERRGGRRAA